LPSTENDWRMNIGGGFSWRSARKAAGGWAGLERGKGAEKGNPNSSNLFRMCRFSLPWPETTEWRSGVAQLHDILWQFVRGALPVGDFESWCYQAPELESCLGKDFYLDVVATPFDDQARVTVLKRSLYTWLRNLGYPTCECFLWGSLQQL